MHWLTTFEINEGNKNGNKKRVLKFRRMYTAETGVWGAHFFMKLLVQIWGCSLSMEPLAIKASHKSSNNVKVIKLIDLVF